MGNHTTDKQVKALGLMSGTSLDGVDLALCRFHLRGEKWAFEIERAETIPYSGEWEAKLKNLHMADADQILETNAALGRHFACLINEFLKDDRQELSIIASHGHTVFHRPEKDYTLQIGSGAHIAAMTGIDTVCDFRTKDIALGGQGAPLVPIGDQYLFPEYDACLNLGGIANISYKGEDGRKAYDICPVNMALNLIANQSGYSYDPDGTIARSGNVNETLLEKLNGLDFYKHHGPKSLGKEWFEREFRPFMSGTDQADLARTVTEHIAIIHKKEFEKLPAQAKILVTGGGAYNKFLMELMQQHTGAKLIVPEDRIVQFKEALVFAFLGALYYSGRINVLSSSTGSTVDHIGGAMYRGQ